MSHRIKLSALVAVLMLVTAPGEAQGPPQPELIQALPTTPTQEVAQILDQALYAYQLLELPLTEIERQVRRHGRLKLYLGDRSLDLELEANDQRTAVSLKNSNGRSESAAPSSEELETALASVLRPGGR